MSYFGMHNHTHYSNIRLLDSISRENDLIDNAFEKGLKGIAITDHDVLSGHVKAIQHFKENYKDKDFKLALGNEIYITREGLDSENFIKGEKFYHFLLLAKNKKGHEQIREISSRAWSRSFMKNMMRTPTYFSDLKEIIGNEKGNIIATTACLAGIPAVLFGAYGSDAKPSITDQLAKIELIFGKGNFFIELQPSKNTEQIEYNKFMIENYWNDYPFVFTTDSHYLNKEDALIHKQFLNSKVGSNREADKYYSSAYVMTYEEVKEYFKYISEEKIEIMRLNSLEILDEIETYDLFHEQIVPEVPVDFSDKDRKILKEKVYSFFEKGKYEYIDKYLETENMFDIDFIIKVFNGFFDKIELNSKEDEEKYFARLDIELSEIYETSVNLHQPLSKYFTTMAKMIEIIWTDGDSLVGVSRGSAAGFIVNYALGITQLDPMSQALEMPHWRFIHKDRPGLPD